MPYKTFYDKIIIMKKIFFTLIIICSVNCLFSYDKYMKLFVGEHEFLVEVAITFEERALGLMNRKQLPDNYGMLFIFNNEEYQSFWMKNTLIPLDIIYADKDKKIVHIYHNVQPCKEEECPTYPSSSPAQYVLEIYGGSSKKMNIKEGDRLIF